MSEIRENWAQFKNLFGILWYWGSFPLSFVTYAVGASLGVGFLMGKFL